LTAILTNACKNALLDSAVAAALNPATPFLALHTGFPPAVNPGNEVTGGAPAYARKAITWQAAGAVVQGQKDITAAVTFDVPAGTVRAVSLVDSSSGAATMRAWMPAGSTARRAFTVNAAGVTADAFDSPAHGLANGNSVLVWPTIGAVLPTGVAEDTEYFVVGVTTDTFQLSLTLGGAAINITAIGDGDVQKFTPEVFAAQGTYQVSAFSVALPG
jgi:hypothetical protein